MSPETQALARETGLRDNFQTRNEFIEKAVRFCAGYVSGQNAIAYDLRYQLREEVLRTYKKDLPERLPLSRQKEFKRSKNLVVEEAPRLARSSIRA